MAEERGRILVVDDNRISRLKLSLSLEQQGHSVRLAENGQSPVRTERLAHAYSTLKQTGQECVVTRG